MKTFLLHIVTPESDFYKGEAEYLSVNTPDGKAGFLSGASPRVLLLSAGEISVKTSVVETRMIVGDGIVSVSGDGITVVTESCRFEGDAEQSDGNNARDESDRNYKRMRAKLASAVKNMKGGTPEEI